VLIVFHAVAVHPYVPPVLRDCTITLPVAPVVVMADPLVYVAQVPPPLMLRRYSLAAPVDPPEPPVPVTVPALYPAQMVVPLIGLAVPRVGATGAVPMVHVAMAPHAVAVHPYVPPVLRDCTITLPVAPVVEIAALLVYADQSVPPLILTRYSLAAPADPPDPPVPVTVPVLKPAQMVVPLAGEAVPSVGATGVVATGHVTMVVGPVALQP